MDGCDLSNKACCEHIMPAQGDKGSAILVIHFIVGDSAALIAKLRTRRSASVYIGELAYYKRSEAFKDKARLQLHSKNFGFVIVYL